MTAAADGDVLLVREGAYSFLVIAGKGLTIQGQGAVSVAASPFFGAGATVIVQGLAADQAVHLRGLDIGAFGGGEQETVVVDACAGPVLLEDCEVSGVGEPIVIQGCASVTLVRCSLLAPPTFASTAGFLFLAHVPYAGMVATDSSVFLYDSVVRGSAGPDSHVLPFIGAIPPAPSGPGIVAGGSTLLLSGCTVAGGDGGSDALPACEPGADGSPGDAVILHASLDAAPGLFLAPYAVALHMALPLGTIPLGALPPSGQIALDLVTPALPAGVGAVRLVGQALFVGGSGFFDGGPSTLLILDPTL